MLGRVVFALFAGALAACSVRAAAAGDAYINGSFEHSTPQGHPVWWYIEADPATVEVNVDGTHAREGAAALHVRIRPGEPAFVYTPLPSGECLSRAEASAAVLARSQGVSVALFYLTPGAPPQMGGSNGSPGDGGWQTISVSRTASEGCLSEDLMLGIAVSGEGDAWIDDVRLSISPQVVPVADGPPSPHTDRDLADIRQHAVPVGVDRLASREGRREIRPLFENARVVGLGENSHGARALFRFKHALVRVLVEDFGFNLFALEMPADRARTVNDYVQWRTDDAGAALLALSYPAWQSQEMWAVIQWLRERNRGADEPAAFFGLDMPPDGNASDDRRMADRAAQIMAEADEGARMIVWADNTHVTKEGRAMGALLSERFGREYVAVGLTFDEGHYSAYGPEQRYPVHEGYPGTHEHVLAQAGPDAFLLELDALPARHALREARGFRYIGSQPQPFHQFYPHRLIEHFDIIGFVRSTESTQYLLNHQF